MKKLNKFLALLLLFALLFSICACSGEIIGPSGVGTGKPGGDNSEDEYVPPVLNDDPTDDFTVTLLADGQPYTPRMEMFAYWSDGYSIHTAKFDSEGIARIDGLDGDYRVTLSEVPSGYTYDPNTNIATNDQRNIVLNLRKLNVLAGGGTGLYDCYSFSKTGVYIATIDGPDDGIYFQYSPDRSGVYSIESWINLTKDISSKESSFTFI